MTVIMILGINTLTSSWTGKPSLLPREQASEEAMKSGVAKLVLRYVVYYFLSRDHEVVSFTHVSNRPLTPFAPQGARGKRTQGGGGTGAGLGGTKGAGVGRLLPRYVVHFDHPRDLELV